MKRQHLLRVGIVAAMACSCHRGGTTASRTAAIPTPPPSFKEHGPSVADETFRASAPPADPRARFTPPDAHTFALSNGLRVVLIERHDLPLVAMQFLLPHGTDDVRPRVGSLAMDALLRGSRDRTGASARERLDAMAVVGSTWGSFDSIGLRIDCVRDKVRPALAVLADAAMRPTIEGKDLELVRRETLERFDSDKNALSTVQQWAIREALYPIGHPYREVRIDRASDIRAITRADVLHFLKTHLTPNGMTAIVAGDITPADLGVELEEAFGRWTGPPTFRPPAPAKPVWPKGAPRVFLVDRPNASQTHVAVVAPSLARSSEDYVPAMVFNRILGGTVSSRLGKNLREQKGLTYGVWSTIATRHGPGEFTAGGAVVRDKTGLAVREILREIDRLAKDPVSADELASATEGMIHEFPARFETLGGILWNYGEAPVHGLAPDELWTRLDRIAAVRPEDILRIGATYVHADALRVVVTGDARIVKGDLEALDMGPIRTIEPAAVARVSGRSSK